MFRYRAKELAKKIIKELKKENLQASFMHVCGTHQDTLIRFGLDKMLEATGIKILQGPGCPICVTLPEEIDRAVFLAKKNKVITTYGDLVRVPGSEQSLADVRTKGDVKIVYSIDDAVKLAEQTKKEVVFVSIGFETTAPNAASAILSAPPKNFSILSFHRLIPPALKALLELGDVKIDGLIEPGHVSTIIGAKPYEFLSEKYKIPQVIAGFEPLDLLMGIYMLVKQLKRNEPKVEIEYKRSVRYNGNEKAVRLMNEVFEPRDIAWRGFPVIKSSGLKLKKEFMRYDAEKKFENELEPLKYSKPKKPKNCLCHLILRGLASSEECKLFGSVCTPTKPVGPCMVSREGNCNIMFRYRKRESS